MSQAGLLLQLLWIVEEQLPVQSEQGFSSSTEFKYPAVPECHEPTAMWMAFTQAFHG